jgi:hypothetical protein
VRLIIFALSTLYSYWQWHSHIHPNTDDHTVQYNNNSSQDKWSWVVTVVKTQYCLFWVSAGAHEPYPKAHMLWLWPRPYRQTDSLIIVLSLCLLPRLEISEVFLIIHQEAPWVANSIKNHFPLSRTLVQEMTSANVKRSLHTPHTARMGSMGGSISLI